MTDWPQLVVAASVGLASGTQVERLGQALDRWRRPPAKVARREPCPATLYTREADSYRTLACELPAGHEGATGGTHRAVSPGPGGVRYAWPLKSRPGPADTTVPAERTDP